MKGFSLVYVIGRTTAAVLPERIAQRDKSVELHLVEALFVFDTDRAVETAQ